MVEWYEAYADYEDEAERLEEIVRGAAARGRLRGRARLLRARGARVGFVEAIAAARPAST